MQGADSIVDFCRLKLRYLATNSTYLVAVAVIVVAGFVFCRTLETVSDDQTQFHKQLQRVVKSGPAYGKPLLFVKLFAQFLQREMIIGIVDRIEDSKTLWSLAQMVLFQIAGQNISDRFFNVFFHFMWLNRLKTAQNYKISERKRKKIAFII